MYTKFHCYKYILVIGILKRDPLRQTCNVDVVLLVMCVYTSFHLSLVLIYASYYHIYVLPQATVGALIMCRLKNNYFAA